ncbi:MAG: MFS transporter [Promethearchaeota archaeon]|nr:MAG: MFS transporter [Candidatus Lokiarchaeota archaeon]
MSKKERSSGRKALFYSFGQISDVTAYQSFILLIFTFYFSVVGIDTWLIVLGYSVWAVWNAFNDPMVGFISDRTHTKLGRRLPYIIGAFIPLAFTVVLLYFPPVSFGNTNQLANFIYFFIIIVVFELFYTIYSLNMTSLFPEIFITQQERTQANNIRQVFTIVGLIFAFILPGIIIPDWTDPINLPQYQLFGFIAAIIVVVFVLLFLLFGPRERVEFQQDYQKAFGFFGNIKYCFKSKSFRWYIIAETCVWFVYGMLPTIVPLYAENVLNVTGFNTSLLLATTFISATIFMTFLWKPVVRKVGNRQAWIISFFIWIAALSGTLFISEFIGGLIVFFLIGIGLSGSFFVIDLVVADIVDEDELSTGMRREAGYYGVNAFILRFSNVLVILAIGIVFSGTEWGGGYVPNPGINVTIGLRILMFVLPAIALVIAAIAIFKYPLYGQKLVEMKNELNQLHEEKRARVA